MWWSRDLTFVNEDCPSVQMMMHTDFNVNSLVSIVDCVILISIWMKQYTSHSLTVRFIQNIKKCNLSNLHCSVCMSWNKFKCVFLNCVGIIMWGDLALNVIFSDLILKCHSSSDLNSKCHFSFSDLDLNFECFQIWTSPMVQMTRGPVLTYQPAPIVWYQ